MQKLASQRLMDRLATGMSIGMLIALSLFSIHLAQQAEKERNRPASVAPDPREADYFVDKLTLFTLDPQGAPAWRLEARSLRHYPADDSAHFELPVLVSLNPDRPAARLSAQTGRWLNALPDQAGRPARAQSIDLTGDVQVERAATPPRAAMHAFTERAHVLPDTEQVSSDLPVRILEGEHRLAGTGFHLDLHERTLRLDSRVKALWHSPDRAR
ncbi:MAG: LPS export ABC transporter periplasmic protein LptC [Burkholderiaceae bacterium]